MRSMLCLNGRSPMSARKLSNERHLLQTVMPRPPQFLKFMVLGLVQRWSICCHDLYVGVTAFLRPCPWAKRDWPHPHDLVLPNLRSPLETTVCVLQSQIHNHLTPDPLLRPTSFSATRRPNRCPVRSILSMATSEKGCCVKWRPSRGPVRSLRSTIAQMGV